MIRGRYLRSNDDLSEVFALRRRVFVEEQGFSWENEIDAYDRMSVYALVYDEEDRPAGTGRLYVDVDGRFTIGRLCVLKENRGMGYGDLLMRMLIARALDLNAAGIYLSAQVERAGFYEKYGFTALGETYPDEGVPHVLMAADRGRLDACGKCSE